jgi:glycosyltransferase involved in cell wall biosynthesis
LKNHFCCFCGIESDSKFGKILQKIIGIFMGRKLIVIGDGLKKKFPRGNLIYRGIDLNEFKNLGRKRTCLGWIKRDWEILSEDEMKILSQKLDVKLYTAQNISPSKMNNFYNKCKIFVSLPKTAGYNNCWNESMAAGVPIIIGNSEGAGSFLPIEKIKKPITLEKLERKIKLAKSKNLRKWLIKNNFSWDDKAHSLIEVFKKNAKI